MGSGSRPVSPGCLCRCCWEGEHEACSGGVAFAGAAACLSWVNTQGSRHRRNHQALPRRLENRDRLPAQSAAAARHRQTVMSLHTSTILQENSINPLTFYSGSFPVWVGRIRPNSCQRPDLSVSGTRGFLPIHGVIFTGNHGAIPLYCAFVKAGRDAPPWLVSSHCKG